MNNKNIFARLFDSFDTGAFFKKPLQWIYILFGIANLCYPIYLTIQVKSNDDVADVTTGMVISLIYLFFVGIFNVYYWINRSENLNKYVTKDNDMIVIPLIAHMTKSFGEWLGMNTLLDAIPLMVLKGKILGEHLPVILILFIFIGCIFLSYFMILLGHFVAEEINVFAAIANNTKIISTACTEGKAPTPEAPATAGPQDGNELKPVNKEEGSGPKVKQVSNTKESAASLRYPIFALIGLILITLFITLLVMPSHKSESSEPQNTEVRSDAKPDTAAVVDSMPSDYSIEDSSDVQSYGDESNSSDYSSDDEYPSGDEYGNSSY